MHAALPVPEEAPPEDAALDGRDQDLSLWVPFQLLLEGEESRGHRRRIRGGGQW